MCEMWTLAISLDWIYLNSKMSFPLMKLSLVKDNPSMITLALGGLTLYTIKFWEDGQLKYIYFTFEFAPKSYSGNMSAVKPSNY